MQPVISKGSFRYVNTKCTICICCIMICVCSEVIINWVNNWILLFMLLLNCFYTNKIKKNVCIFPIIWNKDHNKCINHSLFYSAYITLSGHSFRRSSGSNAVVVEISTQKRWINMAYSQYFCCHLTVKYCVSFYVFMFN